MIGFHKKNKKTNLLLKKIIFIFFSIVFFFSCTNDLEQIKALIKEEERPDISVVNIESIHSTDAQVKIRITAPLVNKYNKPEEPYFEFPEGILIEFFGKNLTVESSLKADYAIYFEKKKFGKAEKNVILTNINGSIVRTEQLFLDEKEQKIYSEKPVTITETNGTKVHGKGGFESNMNFTVYQFVNVTGVLPMLDDIMPDEDK